LIEYEDLFYVPYTVKRNASFDFQITNAVQNPVALLMIPILADEYNGHVDNQLNPCLSPFTTGTNDHQSIGITKFQC
jgi:hypothetical protein